MTCSTTPPPTHTHRHTLSFAFQLLLVYGVTVGVMWDVCIISGLGTEVTVPSHCGGDNTQAGMLACVGQRALSDTAEIMSGST